MLTKPRISLFGHSYHVNIWTVRIASRSRNMHVSRLLKLASIYVHEAQTVALNAPWPSSGGGCFSPINQAQFIYHAVHRECIEYD